MHFFFETTSVGLSLCSFGRNIEKKVRIIFRWEKLKRTSQVLHSDACEFNLPRKSKQCDDLRTLISKFLIVPFFSSEKMENNHHNKFHMFDVLEI